MKIPLVSVVIPVYNEEKYLSQSVESVLSQTYKNFECIIVNNFSTDESLNIARKYEKSDNRIKVYDNDKFLNQLQNHNEALKKISGSSKYTKMVLGDDFIFRECLEKMVEVAESDPLVGVVSSYALRGTEVVHDGLPLGSNVYDGKEICKRYLIDNDFYLFGTQTSVMFRSEHVRKKGIFFDECSLSADTDVCMEILKDHKFGFVHQVLTYTRTDNISEYGRARKYDNGSMRKLILFVRYGKYFLNDEEYRIEYRKTLDGYYKSISAKILINRSVDFWEYHEAEMGKAGLKIEKSKILKSIFTAILDKALNPKRTIEDMYLNRKYIKNPP